MIALPCVAPAAGQNKVADVPSPAVPGSDHMVDMAAAEWNRAEAVDAVAITEIVHLASLLRSWRLEPVPLGRLHCTTKRNNSGRPVSPSRPTCTPVRPCVPSRRADP